MNKIKKIDVDGAISKTMGNLTAVYNSQLGSTYYTNNYNDILKALMDNAGGIGMEAGECCKT